MSSSAAVERVRAKAKIRGIRFSPPLTDTGIADFERRTGVSLPADYREFLSQIGNGGVGPPSYGLCPLGSTPSDFDGSLDLSKPFPFTKPWIWEDGAVSSEGGQDDVNCGVLIIGTDGCGQYWALVVRGPDCGKIWMLTDVGITPLAPGMSFLEWCEAWLDGKRDWWA
jgi:hypothetical protein